MDEPKESENIRENLGPKSTEAEKQMAPPTEETLESLKAKIADLEEAASSFKDQLLRKAADFENFKKRIENDFAALAKFSNEELISQLLPVLDDFSRSLKAGKNSDVSDSFYRGIELIYNKFRKILETQGVRELEAVGKPLDVYYHDVLMQVPRKDVPPHTVVEEVEKGYTLHGKVIRHAKVIVAAEPEEAREAGIPAVRDEPNEGKQPTTRPKNEEPPG